MSTGGATRLKEHVSGARGSHKAKGAPGGATRLKEHVSGARGSHNAKGAQGEPQG